VANVMYIGDAWQHRKPKTPLLEAQQAGDLVIVVAGESAQAIETGAKLEWVQADLATLEAQGRALDLLRQRLPLSVLHYALPAQPGPGAEAKERFLKQGLVFPTLLVNALLGLTKGDSCCMRLYASPGSCADSAAMNAYWQTWLGANDAAISQRIEWVPAPLSE
jgi:hypothetical protein